MYRTRYDIADATLVAKACSSVPDHGTYKRLHGCTPDLPCWRVRHAVRVFSFARRSRLQTYRKNGKWYVRFKDGMGRWRDTSTKAGLKTEAKELAKELERKAERQRRGLEPLPTEEQSVTFGELMDWWWQDFGRRMRSQMEAISKKRGMSNLAIAGSCQI
jgi:hypothetical protein